MPHIADAHREARLREVLGEASERNPRWAVADERGFLREVSPGFVHSLREHWPDWLGSLLPQALLECVQLAKPFNTARLKIKVTDKGKFRYLQVRALALSPATVRNHIANCYRKLSVNNKSELLLRVSQTKRGGC